MHGMFLHIVFPLLAIQASANQATSIPKAHASASPHAHGTHHTDEAISVAGAGGMMRRESHRSEISPHSHKASHKEVTHGAAHAHGHNEKLHKHGASHVHEAHAKHSAHKGAKTGGHVEEHMMKDGASKVKEAKIAAPLHHAGAASAKVTTPHHEAAKVTTPHHEAAKVTAPHHEAAKPAAAAEVSSKPAAESAPEISSAEFEALGLTDSEIDPDATAKGHGKDAFQMKVTGPSGHPSCLSETHAGYRVRAVKCAPHHGQQWYWDAAKKHLKTLNSDSRCLGYSQHSGGRKELAMYDCDTDSMYTAWIVDKDGRLKTEETSECMALDEEGENNAITLPCEEE